jgi:hypothetical protein
VRKLVSLSGILLLSAIACRSADAQGTDGPGLAVLLSPIAGWQAVHSGQPGDQSVELQTSHLGTPARLDIWEEDEAARSLRGVWTSLRYSVVVEKGGAILRDVPVNFGGTTGRELLYRIRDSNGKAEVFLDAVVIKNHHELTAHCSLAGQHFTAYAGEVEKMLALSRFIPVGGPATPGPAAPKSQETPKESAPQPVPTPEAKP